MIHWLQSIARPRCELAEGGRDRATGSGHLSPLPDGLFAAFLPVDAPKPGTCYALREMDGLVLADKT